MRIELEIHEKLIYMGKPEMRPSRLLQPNQKAARTARETAVYKYNILRATYINCKIS